MTITTIKDDHGNTIHDEKLIANQLNKYFVEICPRLSSQLLNNRGKFSEYLKPVDCEYQFTTISNDVIFNKIIKIKSNKAAGFDKIPQKLIKDSAVIVTLFLNIILNLSLSEGEFPSDWKNAKDSNVEIKKNVAAVGLYLSYLLFPKFFEKLLQTRY